MMPWQDDQLVMRMKTTMLFSPPPFGPAFFLARLELFSQRTINRAPGAKPIFLRES